MKTKYIALFFIATLFLSIGCAAKKKQTPPQESPPIESKKPIIYLYPTEKTEVNIRLNYNGKLTTTYPKYDAQQGWTVIAEPNGNLYEKTTGKEFYALYWEGENHFQQSPKTGFVVKGSETANFLDKQLAILGLNAKERNEFIIYWLPQMEHHAYNFIHFAGKNYTENAVLTITPKPETLIRVFMEFSALEHPIKVEPQILKPVERKGFTVVEWGGSELENNPTKMQ